MARAVTSTLRGVALVLVAGVLASMSFVSTPDEPVRGAMHRPLGPSMLLLQSLHIPMTVRRTPPPTQVVTGVGAPRPEIAQMHLGDRPSLSRGQGKPNIVLVLTDDMAWRDLASMPAVRRLIADGGTTFDQAFSSDSLCCPARATLVTGRAAHNHRTMGNGPSSLGGWEVFKHFNDTSRLLPVWLQNAGYRTWMMGKYLNGYDGNDPQPGWDYFYAPTAGIFNPFRWTASVNHDWVRYRRSYQQSVVTQYAREDLATFARRGEPFFMFVQSIAPHGFFMGGHWVNPIPEAKYRDTVAPTLMTLPANWQEWDSSDKSEWVRTLPLNVNPPSYMWARRLESLKSVDDTVAALVDQAKRSGVYDNTIFLFTSDNGYSFGSHRYTGKNVPYEESIRIPLVAIGPGFDGHGMVRAQVTLQDLTAAVVKAAGAKPAWPLDGVPLQDIAASPGRFADRPVLFEGSVAGLPGAPSLPVDNIGRFYQGVRWRGWKLIQYATGESELYDLRRDPAELRNVYDGRGLIGRRKDEAAAVQRSLETWMAQHNRCVGARQCDASPPDVTAN